MIHLNNVKYLAGKDINVKPVKPFDSVVLDFLDSLSKQLLTYRNYPDIVTFGFYIRKANILKLQEQYDNYKYRIGRGLVFHIAPSNVPVNFAYSFIFGLLSGNSNIIKVSSKEFEQVDIIINEINKLYSEEKYESIKYGNIFIKYTNIDEVTSHISSLSDARIIWGGDETIEHIRRFPIKIRGKDIFFADRYSICIINSDTIIENINNHEWLTRLAKNFFNDVYLFDQNACSSPQMVFWCGNNIVEAKNIFWNYVRHAVQNYDLSPIKIIDKYTNMLSNIIDFNILNVKQYGNEIYCIQPDSINERLTGKFGVFYEFDINSFYEISEIIKHKCQTITYCGIDKNELAMFIIEHGLLGADRIVPIGMALDIGLIWDGYNLIDELSRIIDII